MSRAYKANEGKEELHTGFWWRKLREGDHLENSGLDSRIILKWISRIGMRELDWIGLAFECGNKLLGFLKCGKVSD
jgi:hypothetical protein